MIIGIPREIMRQESRVSALPNTVREYIAMGFEVLVESQAGAGVYRSDDEYRQAGAKIVEDPRTLFDQANLILKVKQPLFNEVAGEHETALMREGSTLITFLHPAAPGSHSNIRALQQRKITAFTMDSIPRIPRAQRMDALTSMSTVSGYKAVLIAAEHFPRFIPIMGTASGTIEPANILVIGTGVVGLQAIATARRLGGKVQAVDIREDARKESASLKARVIGYEVPGDLAIGPGGYAKALSEEWLEKERQQLAEALKQADVVILSALVPGEIAPVLITEAMVKKMQPGSVIVDVSVDQGGNCAITEAGKEIVKHGVCICGTENIPGAVAVDATRLYASNMLEYVKNLFKQGIGIPDMDDEIVQESIVTCQGRIHHKGTLKAMCQASSSVAEPGRMKLNA
jgi:NAD(P) transhydrogenase subunit alpha